MTFLNVLQGLGSLLVLFVGVTLVYALVKGGWRVLLRAMQAMGQFMAGLFRNPGQAVVDAPFLIQLVLLPFLLVWEQVEKWRHPEEARRKQALFKRNQAAAQVFQSRLGQVALYREGSTINLCKIVDFEVSEHLVRFDAEPVAHAGFSQGMEPWHFSINWDYFFYDSHCWAADSQFMNWRVNFDDGRIEKLKAYALTLAPDTDADERYRQLNHFFTYGEAAQDREAVQLALAGLKAYIHAQPDGAWLQTLPEALKAEVNIMSMHAFPGYPDADEEIQFEERRGDCVMWVPMHPNPWRIQFSYGHLLKWWRLMCSHGATIEL
jgi:hypothetical protein